MPEAFPEEVFNHDVVGLYNRIARVYDELARSQSAPVSGMVLGDRVRLRSYILEIRQFQAWVQDQPELDLPESHPRPYKLETFPAEIDVESEEIATLLYLVRAAAIELTNSQSARFACRLQPFDAARVTAIVNKIEKFLTDFIEQVTPMDLPESSPQESMPPAGRMGVAGS